MSSKRFCSLLTAAVCTGTAVWSLLGAVQNPVYPLITSAAQAVADAAVKQPCIYLSSVTAEPGDTVYINVLLKNNTGFAHCGFTIDYGSSGLQPVLKTDTVPDYQAGKIAGGLHLETVHNPETHMIAVGTIGEKNVTDSGIFLTLQFQIPEDAGRGTSYPLKLIPDKFYDSDMHSIDMTAQNGEITVAPETTTTTTTTTTTWP